MEHNYADNGYRSLFASVFLGIVNFLTPENIHLIIHIFTGAGAFVAAIFSARYYWYAVEEKKKNIKGE